MKKGLNREVQSFFIAAWFALVFADSEKIRLTSKM